MKRLFVFLLSLAATSTAWSGWFDEPATFTLFSRGSFNVPFDRPRTEYQYIDMSPLKNPGVIERVLGTEMRLEGTVTYIIKPNQLDIQTSARASGQIFVRSQMGYVDDVDMRAVWSAVQPIPATGYQGSTTFTATQSWAVKPFGGFERPRAQINFGGESGLLFATSGQVSGRLFAETKVQVDPNSVKGIGGGTPLQRGTLIDRIRHWLTGSSDRPVELVPQAPNQRSVAGVLHPDAAPIIRADLRDHEQPQLGDIGVWLETASPASIYHSIGAYAAPRSLSFDVTFLSSSADFSVQLGTLSVFSMAATSFNVGQAQRIDIVLDPVGIDSELTFLLDGAAGQGVVLTNLTFGDLSFSDDGWFSRGHVTSSLIYVTTAAQAATINQIAAGVPEPGTWLLFGAGLMGVGLRTARLRQATA